MKNLTTKMMKIIEKGKKRPANLKLEILTGYNYRC